MKVTFKVSAFICLLCSNWTVGGWVRKNLNVVRIVKSAQNNGRSLRDRSEFMTGGMVTFVKGGGYSFLDWKYSGGYCENGLGNSVITNCDQDCDRCKSDETGVSDNCCGQKVTKLETKPGWCSTISLWPVEMTPYLPQLLVWCSKLNLRNKFRPEESARLIL